MLIGDWFVYQIPRVLHGPPRCIYVGYGRYSLLTSCHVVSVYSWGCVKVYSPRLHQKPNSTTNSSTSKGHPRQENSENAKKDMLGFNQTLEDCQMFEAK